MPLKAKAATGTRRSARNTVEARARREELRRPPPGPGETTESRISKAKANLEKVGEEQGSGMEDVPTLRPKAKGKRAVAPEEEDGEEEEAPKTKKRKQQTKGKQDVSSPLDTQNDNDVETASRAINTSRGKRKRAATQDDEEEAPNPAEKKQKTMVKQEDVNSASHFNDNEQEAEGPEPKRRKEVISRDATSPSGSLGGDQPLSNREGAFEAFDGLENENTSGGAPGSIQEDVALAEQTTGEGPRSSSSQDSHDKEEDEIKEQEQNERNHEATQNATSPAGSRNQDERLSHPEAASGVVERLEDGNLSEGASGSVPEDVVHSEQTRKGKRKSSSARHSRDEDDVKAGGPKQKGQKRDTTQSATSPSGSRDQDERLSNPDAVFGETQGPENVVESEDKAGELTRKQREKEVTSHSTSASNSHVQDQRRSQPEAASEDVRGLEGGENNETGENQTQTSAKEQPVPATHDAHIAPAVPTVVGPLAVLHELEDLVKQTADRAFKTHDPKCTGTPWHENAHILTEGLANVHFFRSLILSSLWIECLDPVKETPWVSPYQLPETDELGYQTLAAEVNRDGNLHNRFWMLCKSASRNMLDLPHFRRDVLLPQSAIMANKMVLVLQEPTRAFPVGEQKVSSKFIKRLSAICEKCLYLKGVLKAAKIDVRLSWYRFPREVEEDDVGLEAAEEYEEGENIGLTIRLGLMKATDEGEECVEPAIVAIF